MTALELFRKANIKLAFDWNSVQDYAPYAAVGAGVGGLGMGISSAFGGDPNETSSDRRKRILQNSLLGAGLGGLVGTGYHAMGGGGPSAAPSGPPPLPKGFPVGGKPNPADGSDLTAGQGSSSYFNENNQLRGHTSGDTNPFGAFSPADRQKWERYHDQNATHTDANGNDAPQADIKGDLWDTSMRDGSERAFAEHHLFGPSLATDAGLGGAYVGNRWANRPYNTALEKYNTKFDGQSGDMLPKAPEMEDRPVMRQFKGLKGKPWLPTADPSDPTKSLMQSVEKTPGSPGYGQKFIAGFPDEEARKFAYRQTIANQSRATLADKDWLGQSLPPASVAPNRTMGTIANRLGRTPLVGNALKGSALRWMESPIRKATGIGAGFALPYAGTKMLQNAADNNWRSHYTGAELGQLGLNEKYEQDAANFGGGK